jgi:PKD repeat protein
MSLVGRKGGSIAVASLMLWACFLGIGITLVPNAVAGTVVGGHMTKDTTWTESNSPYWVISTLFVDNNVTLTIEPGVEVRFSNWTSMYVSGVLRSQGNSSKRVVLTSNNTAPSPYDWGNVTIDTSGNAEIFHTDITYGQGVLIRSPWNTIGHSKLSHNYVGVTVWASNNTFHNNTISDNLADGMRFGGGGWFNNVFNSTITNNRDYGIGITQDPGGKIYGNEILENYYGGIQVRNVYGWDIACNLIKSNKYYGFYMYKSSVSVHHNNVVNNSDNAYDDQTWNYWDLWSEGNYWDDYNGSDTDGDGIGETPYYILPYNQDDYPFVNPITSCPGGPTGDPPIAVAKPDTQTVNIGQLAWLNGSDSYDPDGTIVSYYWLFGDGGSAWGEVVSHAYSAPGNYTVTLTVKDDDGLTNQDQAQVNVVGYYPVAIAKPISQTVGINDPAWFNGSDSYDLDGWIVSYYWLFGDGGSAWGVNVSHSYSILGNYTVTLTVEDNDGLADDDQVLVTVVGYPPTADAGPDQVVHAKQTLELNGSNSQDSDGFIVDWLWDFGDGSAQEHGEVVQHVYDTVGNYTATLWVTDDDNLTGSDTAQIDVLPELVPPVADPNGPYAGRKNFAVILSGNGSSDIDGVIVDLIWDFGDGSPKEHGWWVSHVYSSGGMFTVTLNVTDDDGLTDEATTYANITDLEPGEAETQDAVLSGDNLANVTITWSPSPDDGGIENDVVGYEIYVGTSYNEDGTGYALINTLPPGSISYIHSGAGQSDLSTYFYIVKAVDDAGQKSFGQQAVKLARNMPAGMQLISIPVLMSDTSIPTVFQTVDFTRVIYYDANAGKRHNWRTFDTRKPYKDLTHVSEIMALWVEVSKDSYLIVAGLVPESTTIGLVVGWNFIGYASFIDRTVGDSFAGAIYQKVEGYDPTNSPWFLKTLFDSDIMSFGNGYWIHVSEEFDWTVTN